MQRITFAFVFLALAACQSFAPAAKATEPVRAGVVMVEVTPPIGYRMSGYFYERLSTGTHNLLHAKAIVLEQGDQRFAWVFCDMVGVPSSVTSKVRTEAAKATGIPHENIFIGATHSHTGPLYFGPLRDYFHKTAIDKAGSDSQEAVDYPAEFSKKLVDVITSAAKQTEPVELSAGFAEQLGLSFNRRYKLRNGTVATNPGKLNPNIVGPAGPIDPQVGLLQLRRNGKPVAGLTVFALHADTTGGTEFSADYPFFLGERLKRDLGPEYLSIFAPGTCGDINHLDLSTARLQKSHQESQRIGDTLGTTVAAALKKLPAIDQPKLASASKTVSVPLQRYTPAEIAAAREKLSKVGTRTLPMVEQVAAVKVAGIGDYGTDKLPMDIQAFRLSDSVAIVALPGELFSELGLDIKKRSPFPTTIVVELSNDYPGYIPTRRGFAEGGYEPNYSKLEPGGGELLAEAAVQLLTELHSR